MLLLLTACPAEPPPETAAPDDTAVLDEVAEPPPRLDALDDPCEAPVGPWRLEIVEDQAAVVCSSCGLDLPTRWSGPGVIGSGAGPVLWPQARTAGEATCSVGPASLGTTVAAGEALTRVELAAWDDEDLVGLAVGEGADFDGDGAMDLVLGAPYADDLYWAEGAALVVPGGQLGRGGQLELVGMGRLTGSASADFLGWQVGALEVDGEPLLLVGAPGDERTGENAGAVVARPPVPLATLETHELAALTWLSPEVDAWFGVALDVVEVDGDGVEEVLVGGYGARDDAGEAWLLRPGEDPVSLLASEQPGEVLGLSVARLGDLDGDGLDELGVGAPAVDSPLVPAVYVWNQGTVTSQEDEVDSQLGYALTGLGDRDGDGLDDWAVSAPGLGEVRVVLAEGVEVASGTAHALAGPGDLDGDGLAELVLGEGKALDRVTIVLADQETVVHQGEELSFFGWSVAGAGDLDGDGFSELLVGRPGWDEPDTEAGGVVLLTAPVVTPR